MQISIRPSLASIWLPLLQHDLRPRTRVAKTSDPARWWGRVWAVRKSDIVVENQIAEDGLDQVDGKESTGAAQKTVRVAKNQRNRECTKHGDRIRRRNKSGRARPFGGESSQDPLAQPHAYPRSGSHWTGGGPHSIPANCNWEKPADTNWCCRILTGSTCMSALGMATVNPLGTTTPFEKAKSAKALLRIETETSALGIDGSIRTSKQTYWH